MVESAEQTIEDNLVTRFEAVVRRFPRKLAFVGAGHRLDYAGLNRAANRLAGTLLARIGPGDGRVGLLLDQGANSVTAKLATLKSGKCYLPIDPLLPPEQVRLMLREADVCALVCDAPLASSAAELAGQLPCIDLQSLPEDPEDSVDTDPGAPIAPEDTAYIVYSCGFAGVSRGVIQSHRAAMHAAGLFTRLFAIQPEDRISLLSTPGVADAERDMFIALLNGATLYHYAERDIGLAELPRWIDANRVSIFCPTACVLRRMLASLKLDYLFSNVRVVNMGGEATGWEVVDSCHRHFREDCLLFCGFAMSETNLVTSTIVTRGQPREGACIPLGSPVEGKEILLLDERGEPFDGAGCGEMAIRSRYLASGYVGRPDLSAAAFASEPGNPGCRVFRTGDLARRHADGSYSLVQRGDCRPGSSGSNPGVGASARCAHVL